MKRKLIPWAGLLALVGAALVLGGCEEEDVTAVLGSANIGATKVETLGLEFEAPLALEVDTSNGDVTVRGVAGVQSASVTVTLRSRGQTLEEAQDRVGRIVYRAESIGSRIRLEYRSNEQDDDVRRYSGVDFDVLVPIETRVEVNTSNGTISVEAIDGAIVLDTSNGAIDVYDASGSLAAETSNGRIEVFRFTGEMYLDTSNGDLWLEEVVGRIDAETSNGSVHYAGTPAAGGNRLRTSNGEITVRVPPDASIAFDAVTSSGRIRSSLSLIGDTEGEEWNAQLNPPATITLDVRTSNGTIRIDGLGS